MSETPAPEIILEPGDPGYVDPNAPTVAPTEGEVPPDEGGVHAPPGEDLQHVQQPGESDADFAARTRGVVVDSQSPADIVPNTPQATMGVRVQVEGSDPPVYVGVPPESLEPVEPEEEQPPAEEPPAEEPPTEPVA